MMIDRVHEFQLLYIAFWFDFFWFKRKRHCGNHYDLAVKLIKTNLHIDKHPEHPQAIFWTYQPLF